MRKTVLVINKFCPLHPRAGGAEKHLLEIFSRIGERHDVRLLAAMFPGAKREEDYRNIRITRMGSPRSENIVRFHLLAPFLLRRFVREWKPDILVEDVSVLPFFAPLLCPREKRTVLIHHLNGAQFFRSQKLPYALAGYLAEKLFLLLYTRERVVTVSEWMTEALRARGFADVHKVLNGVDEDLLRIAKQYSPRPTLLFVGRMEYRKGYDLLLDTIPLVRARVPNVRYVFAGPIPIGFHPENKKGVTFLGRVSDEEKRALFAEAWLAVVPSRREGYGITPIEANATGTFVLGNNVDGLRESVQDSVTGVLCDCRIPEIFAQTITDWLDLGKLKSKENNCRAWAKQHSWKKSSEDIESLLLNA